MATTQVIKRGILQTYNPATYTATVLIIEATSYVLSNVPIASSVDGTSAISGASCAVLFLDAQNPTDAVIIGVYGSAPSPQPGRVNFVAGYQQINASTISIGTTSTYQISGNGNIPTGALGVLFSAFFTCTLAGTSISLAPHGGTMANYAQIGNLYTANATVKGNGVLALDANGKIDIQANNGNCVVTLYTYGYVI
jgi:hypothetical protein